MLVLFVFSITPKKYFHDLIADHTDNLIPAKQSASFDDAGYNCHFEKLVAESPFTETVSSQFNFNSPEFIAVKNGSYKTLLASLSLSKDNKGPPMHM